VPGRTFILPGRRSDERRCSRWENSILCGRLRGVYRPDTADHFLSIQCHLFCHLQRKRYPPHYPCRASAQNSPFLFREKGFSRSYQYHYGGLHLSEQSFSHFIPELAGSIISTVLISIGLLFTDWRMALAALWVLPVAFAIVG